MTHLHERVKGRLELRDKLRRLAAQRSVSGNCHNPRQAGPLCWRIVHGCRCMGACHMKETNCKAPCSTDEAIRAIVPWDSPCFGPWTRSTFGAWAEKGSETNCGALQHGPRRSGPSCWRAVHVYRVDNIAARPDRQPYMQIHTHYIYSVRVRCKDRHMRHT